MSVREEGGGVGEHFPSLMPFLTPTYQASLR